MSSAELRRLADDLRNGADKARPESAKVVRKGALNIKRTWSRLLEIRAPVHAPALSRAVSFDEYSRGGGPGAEIGPDKSRRQGPLGNLTEFGSENNRAGKEGEYSLAKEEPHYVRAMRDIADPLD